MPDALIPKAKKCGNCPPLVVPRRSYTPTRPSCIECVEKHLGAAYVLLTEAREGYAYRLRAVGHLFEAEDESQEWPELTRRHPRRPDALPGGGANAGLAGAG